MNTNKKIIISIALIIILVFVLAGRVLAFNPTEWDPGPGKIEEGPFLEKAGIVLGWIQYIGVIVSILALAIIGLKYMLSSVEAKAEYKKTMIPYVVGCFMIMGISIIIALIGKVID